MLFQCSHKNKSMHVFNGQPNTKMIIGLGLDLLMKLATSCIAIPLVDGHEIQVLKSNEFRKTKRRMVWGRISIKGLMGYHSFKTMLDDSYNVQMLQDHLIPTARREFSRRWRLQQSNDRLAQLVK